MKPLPQEEGGSSQAEAKRLFDETILERLVALNAERAADFQNPSAQRAPEQSEIDTGDEAETAIAIPIAAAKARPWPRDAVEQVRAVAEVLASHPGALSVDEVADRFTARGAWKKRLPALLDMLVAIGRALAQDGRYMRTH